MILGRNRLRDLVVRQERRLAQVCKARYGNARKTGDTRLHGNAAQSELAVQIVFHERREKILDAVITNASLIHQIRAKDVRLAKCCAIANVVLGSSLKIRAANERRRKRTVGHGLSREDAVSRKQRIRRRYLNITLEIAALGSVGISRARNEVVGYQIRAGRKRQRREQFQCSGIQPVARYLIVQKSRSRERSS